MRLLSILVLIFATLMLVRFFPRSAHFANSNQQIESSGLVQVHLQSRSRSGGSCKISDQVIENSRADDPEALKDFICHYTAKGDIHVQLPNKEGFFYIPLSSIQEGEEVNEQELVEVFINNILAGYYVRRRLPTKGVENELVLYINGKAMVLSKDGTPLQYSQFFNTEMVKEKTKDSNSFILTINKKNQQLNLKKIPPFMARSILSFEYEEHPKTILQIPHQMKESLKNQDPPRVRELREKHFALWKKYVSNAR